MIATYFENQVLEELCRKLYQDRPLEYYNVMSFIVSKVRMLRKSGIKRSDIITTFSFSNLHYIPFVYQGPEEDIVTFYDGIKVFIEISFVYKKERGQFVHTEPIKWRRDQEIAIHELIQKLVNIKIVIQELSN